MKVAVSATGKTLDALVDPRFGRCACLLFVDGDTRRIIGGGPNEFAAASGGAGPRVARWAIDEGAEVVITGNVGPNALDVLRAGGVRVITGASGRVAAAVATLAHEEYGQSAPGASPPSSDATGDGGISPRRFDPCR